MDIKFIPKKQLSPLEDLHESFTPNEVEKQLLDAVTPKRMSSVNLNSFEENNTVYRKISDVVSPKHNSPSTPV